MRLFLHKLIVVAVVLKLVGLSSVIRHGSWRVACATAINSLWLLMIQAKFMGLHSIAEAAAIIIVVHLLLHLLCFSGRSNLYSVSSGLW